MKITDSGYNLPIIRAINRIVSFETGTTKPMLINGINTSTGCKSEYVVKYIKSQRMSSEASCREIIGSFIAKELDFHVPDPVLIEIDNNFVDTLIGNSSYQVASESIGINFGCKYITGIIQFINDEMINSDLLRQAADIFAFDIFTSNPDRRKDKPNMVTEGKRILIFDHELAFSFVFLLIRSKTPWIIEESELIWIKKHYFYQALKNKECDFSNFVNKLSSLNENFWATVNVNIPEDWKTEQYTKIKEHLDSIIANKEEFLNQLNQLVK